MRGRWAAGIVPRNFCWIIRDHFAVSERPGGYAPNHRKVRRQEELLWLRGHEFTRVVSLLGSTHNLHAYDELGLEWSRFPMPAGAETRDVLAQLYPSIHRWLHNGERLLLHQEELGDRVMGVAAGYLLWSEILPDGPRAISAMEQLLRRQMGTVGRKIVTVVEEVPPFDSFVSVDEAAVPSEALAESGLTASSEDGSNPADRVAPESGVLDPPAVVETGDGERPGSDHDRGSSASASAAEGKAKARPAVSETVSPNGTTPESSAPGASDPKGARPDEQVPPATRK